MVTELVAIPESTHNVLKRLTGQSRPDVALSLVIKELIRFRVEATQARITAYEQKHGKSHSLILLDGMKRPSLGQVGTRDKEPGIAGAGHCRFQIRPLRLKTGQHPISAYNLGDEEAAN